MQDDTAYLRDAPLRDRLKLVTTKARLLTLSHMDRRTTAYKRTAELISALESDLGGDPSTAQRALIERAAVAAAILEDVEARLLQGEAIDPSLHATLSNNLRRLLQTIGLARVPRPVASLEEHMRMMRERPAIQGDNATDALVSDPSDQEEESQAAPADTPSPVREESDAA